MSVLNLNERSKSSGTGEARPVLPTDIYRMKILESKLEDDTFAKPGPDGTLPQKIALTFEITTLSEEQQDAANEAEEDWSAVRIWHRFNPYYGTVKAGGPSKFKEFMDNLVSWGLIKLNLEAFDVDSLVGIELKCSVAQYTKTMGDNAGKPGNKITAFAAVKRGKNTPKPIDAAENPRATPDEDEGLPF